MIPSVIFYVIWIHYHNYLYKMGKTGTYKKRGGKKLIMEALIRDEDFYLIYFASEMHTV